MIELLPCKQNPVPVLILAFVCQTAFGVITLDVATPVTGGGVVQGSTLELYSSVGQTVAANSTSSNLNLIPGVAAGDILNPQARCKDATVQLVGGLATLTVEQVDDGSSDNRGISTRTLSKTEFSSSDVGVQTVQLTVRDFRGLESTCDCLVTVLANQDPEGNSLWMILGN
ncbi:MAG: hypothetical protein SFY68_03795 [Candidatus Sumerlaeia bacterium]|nr:hypothetical protein [Candidatus Sumerlaeia bacterium]